MVCANPAAPLFVGRSVRLVFLGVAFKVFEKKANNETNMIIVKYNRFFFSADHHTKLTIATLYIIAKYERFLFTRLIIRNTIATLC